MTHSFDGTGDDPGRRLLVVGLGNPEADYGGTRHNIGADVVRLLAARHHRDLDRNKRINALTTEVRLAGGARLALVVPTCFMNQSGGPTQAAARWYSAEPADILVVHDDIDLEVGQVRVKRGGGHGGHNGLRDVDRALGTRDYLRLRVGVGRPPGRQPARDHVLRAFTSDEREVVDVVADHAADAAELLATSEVVTVQNRYHGVHAGRE